MNGITRRGFGIGAGALGAAGLLGAEARSAVPVADVPPLNLPIERGASLRVLRPAKFVDPDDRSNALITIRPAGLASLGGRDPGDPALRAAAGDVVPPRTGDDAARARRRRPVASRAAPAPRPAGLSLG